MTKTLKKADQYNDTAHNYLRYWDGRDYEQASEEIAIRCLLKGMKFNKSIDVGGGYGRLSVILRDYSSHVTLVEPSQQQLDIAHQFLKGKSKIDTRLAQAEKLPFDDGEVDLAMIFRVIHHIPDPIPAFQEIYRVLKKDGYFLIEFANYCNFKNRFKYAVKFQKMPIDPVDIRSDENKKENSIPFVNHNPVTVRKQLAQTGFKIERILSVSNFRSPTIKKIIPSSVLVKLEKLVQKPLAKTYFGPSTIYLLKKV